MNILKRKVFFIFLVLSLIWIEWSLLKGIFVFLEILIRVLYMGVRFLISFLFMFFFRSFFLSFFLIFENVFGVLISVLLRLKIISLMFILLLKGLFLWVLMECGVSNGSGGFFYSFNFFGGINFLYCWIYEKGEDSWEGYI